MAILCPSCGTRNLDGTDDCTHCGHDLSGVLPQPARLDQALQKHLNALQLSTIHTITPSTTLEVAVQAMGRQKLDILAVMQGPYLVGLLSVRDIITRVGADYQSKLQMPVRDFMTAEPETLPPDAPIAFALNRMDVGGFRHVPVVQDDKMLGVVSTRNVVRYVVKHA